MEDRPMQTYAINLARSPDRRAHITAQLEHAQVNYQIVDAVDGRGLDLGDARLVEPAFARANTPRPGIVGCSLSHLETYRRIIDDDLEIACILEDDVVIPDDLVILADAIGQQMSGAEIVLLNFHSQEPCRITKANVAHLPLSRLLAQIVDEGQVTSAACYLITREACARMVKTIPPVRVVADDWAFFVGQGAVDRLRCVVPMPVVQNTDLRTTISYHQPDSMYSSVRELISGSRIPILRQALALRRRRHQQRYAVGRTQFVEDIPRVHRNT
jgi:glycosyl transferase family 25